MTAGVGMGAESEESAGDVLSLYRVEEARCVWHLAVTTGEAEALVLTGYGPTGDGHAWVPRADLKVTRIDPDAVVGVYFDEYEGKRLVQKTARQWCESGEQFLASTEW